MPEKSVNGYERCFISVPFAYSITNTIYEVIQDSVGQFTGLKDKNGKDIYEGDILTWKWNNMKREYLVIEDIFTTWREALEFEGRGIGRWELPSICEVIGNVYENPELLNQNVQND